MSKTEVIAYTERAWHDGDTGLLPYTRVVAVSVAGNLAGDTASQDDKEAREFEMDIHLGRRLVQGLELAERQRLAPTNSPVTMNCHLFANILAGNRPSGYPIFNSGVRVEGNLGYGELGVITAERGHEAIHSLVGLGEEFPESIQEMWGTGNVGIVNNQALLEYLDLDEVNAPYYIHREARP